ncbi:MAG: hypothetical protein ABIM50_12130 [Novosphingobium sp.]
MADVMEAPFLRDPLSPTGIGDLPTFYRELREHHPRIPHFRFDMGAAARNPSYFQHGWIMLPVVVGEEQTS